LGIAINASVLAHDVLNGFDEGADGHVLCAFFVDGGLQVVDCLFESRFPPESADEFNHASHGAERGNFQDPGIVEFHYSFVGVFDQQSFQYSPRLWTVFGEGVALLDVLGSLLPGQRLGVKGDVADQIEGVEVLTKFGCDQVNRQPFRLQLLEHGLLALFAVPAFQESIETGELSLQSFACEVAQGFRD
jgi:hypothetical protein